jgi:hypothetical protein
MLPEKLVEVPCMDGEYLKPSVPVNSREVRYAKCDQRSPQHLDLIQRVVESGWLIIFLSHAMKRLFA